MGVSATPRPPYPWKDTIPFVQETGWATRPVWTGADNLAPNRDSISRPSSYTDWPTEGTESRINPGNASFGPSWLLQIDKCYSGYQIKADDVGGDTQREAEKCIQNFGGETWSTLTTCKNIQEMEWGGVWTEFIGLRIGTSVGAVV